MTDTVREIRCGHPEHANKTMQLLYTPVDGHVKACTSELFGTDMPPYFTS